MCRPRSSSLPKTGILDGMSAPISADPEERNGSRANRLPQAHNTWPTVALIVLVILAAFATIVMLVTDSSVWLRVAIGVALWAAVLGAFLIMYYQRRANQFTSRNGLLAEDYQRALQRELDKRDELEKKRRAESGESAQEELEQLRQELTALRISLAQLFGPDFEDQLAIGDGQEGYYFDGYYDYDYSDYGYGADFDYGDYNNYGYRDDGVTEAEVVHDAQVVSETREAATDPAASAAMVREQQRESQAAAAAARAAAEERRVAQLRKEEEARIASEARRAEEARKAEQTEVARREAEERHREAERKAAEEQKAAQARRTEEARRAVEKRRAEEARKAEEARQAAELRRRQEEERLAAVRQAEEAKKAAERVAVEQAAAARHAQATEVARQAEEERRQALYRERAEQAFRASGTVASHTSGTSSHAAASSHAAGSTHAAANARGTSASSTEYTPRRARRAAEESSSNAVFPSFGLGATGGASPATASTGTGSHSGDSHTPRRLAGTTSYTPPTTRSSHAADRSAPSTGTTSSRSASQSRAADAATPAATTPAAEPAKPARRKRDGWPDFSTQFEAPEAPDIDWSALTMDPFTPKQTRAASSTAAQSSVGHTSAAQGARTPGHSAPTAGSGRRTTEEQGSHTSGLSLADIMKRLEQNK